MKKKKKDRDPWVWAIEMFKSNDPSDVSPSAIPIDTPVTGMDLTADWQQNNNFLKILDMNTRKFKPNTKHVLRIFLYGLNRYSYKI